MLVADGILLRFLIAAAVWVVAGFAIASVRRLWISRGRPNIKNLLRNSRALRCIIFGEVCTLAITILTDSAVFLALLGPLSWVAAVLVYDGSAKREIAQ